jgi:hypothetical protein
MKAVKAVGAKGRRRKRQASNRTLELSWKLPERPRKQEAVVDGERVGGFRPVRQPGAAKRDQAIRM